MPDKTRIGLIGLGSMGLGMAACLVRSGFEVTGYDIQQRAIEKLVEVGGKAAQNPRAMAKRSDVLILVVATSEQATSVLFDDDMGAVAALPTNTIVLLCITASAEYVVELGQKLRAIDRSDLRLIDCPISGGETRAWKGTLSLLCAGKESDIDAAMEVLECLSSKVHIVPGAVGAGSTLKLVHQILVGVHILASVEVVGLCHVAGLDPQSVYDNVMEGDGRSWLFEQRAAHMLDEKRVPASSLAIISKDMVMVTESGRLHQHPLPLASIAHELYILSQAAGWGPEDDCRTLNLYLLGKGDMESLRRHPREYDSSRGAVDQSMVSDLLVGIHSAAAIEVLRFAQKLGISSSVVAEVVQGAAGSSAMFSKVATEFDSSANDSLRSIGGFDSMRNKLARAIRAARGLNYPLFISTTALQQYYR